MDKCFNHLKNDLILSNMFGVSEPRKPIKGEFAKKLKALVVKMLEKRK